jgi:hypothetical protein
MVVSSKSGHCRTDERTHLFDAERPGQPEWCPSNCTRTGKQFELPRHATPLLQGIGSLQGMRHPCTLGINVGINPAISPA